MKIIAEPGFIIPVGISRNAVRGFNESKVLSVIRLKAMAAFLANAMQSIIKISKCHDIFSLEKWIARKNPIKAKGIAKIVWLKVTSEK